MRNTGEEIGNSQPGKGALMTFAVIMTLFITLCPRADAGINKALFFDGTNDFVVLPENHGAPCLVSDFTFECWAKPNSVSRGMVFGAYENMNVYVGANSVSSTFLTSGTHCTLTQTTTNSAGKWEYIAIVRQGTTLTAYQNGAKIGSVAGASGTFDMFSGWGGLQIGANVVENPQDAVNGCYAGALDEMRISKIARSGTEIQANWNSGAGKQLQADSNTLALWHFDEGEGATLHDVTTWNDGFLGWYNPSSPLQCPKWVDGFPFPGPTGDFALYIPDFTTRLGVNALAVITGASSTDTFTATLTGSGINQVIYRKLGPPVNCRFTINLRSLAAGAYSLTTQLLDQNNNVIKSNVNLFTKRYNGVPTAGIDENNALVINGKQTVPFAAFALFLYSTPADVTSWVQNGAINSEVIGCSNLVGALGNCATDGIGMIGGADQSWTTSSVQAAVQSASSQSALWSWGLGDEPEWSGVTSATVSACTAVCHTFDPLHPVCDNMSGPMYLTTSTSDGGYYSELQLSYTYPRLVADIYSFDYYPWMETIDNGSTLSQELINLADKACDHVRDWNYDLTPVYGYVDVAQLDSTHTTPSAQYIRIATWVNIIHGVKGIQWFPWHVETSISAANFAQMAALNTQVSHLAPAIFTPNLAGAVVQQAPAGGRIDIMTKLYDGSIYVFAANLMNQTGNCQFTCNAMLGSGTVNVVDEGRTIAVSGNTFTDTFLPYAVHIYSVSGTCPPTIQYWDGSNVTSTSTVAGGSGNWDNNASANWTAASGSFNTTWQGGGAIFSGSGGTVTLTDNIPVLGMEFSTNGYAIAASGTNSLSVEGIVNLTADSGINAIIVAPITGSGSIRKLGTGSLTLSGSNTYTGATTVAAGTLNLTGPFLDGAFPINLNSGGRLGLNFAGSNSVSALSIDGIAQSSGTWGGIASKATYRTALITGTGLLGVSNGPAQQPYASWAAAYDLDATFGPQNGFTDNPAGDGISNLMKYALGLNPLVACGSTSPGMPVVGFDSNHCLTLTFTGTASRVAYSVQSTDDLATWSTLWSSSVGNPPGTVTVSDTIPISSSPKRFMHLQVTGS